MSEHGFARRSAWRSVGKLNTTSFEERLSTPLNCSIQIGAAQRRASRTMLSF